MSKSFTIKLIENTMKLFAHVFALFVTFFIFISQTSAATFELSPSSGNFTEGCTESFQILVDVTGEQSNAADVEITFDPDEIDIIDVENGNAYETYFINSVESNGSIRIAAGSFLTDLSSLRNFATVYFESKTGVSSSSFNISFDGVGETLDSNIADSITNSDILTGVTNATYSFTTGNCEPDNQAPNVTFHFPEDGTVGISSSGVFEIQITDDLSGIDLSTVTINLNGQIYNPSSANVNYDGSPMNYTFFLTTEEGSVFADQTNTLTVSGSDLEGNTFSESITFNTPPGVPTPSPTPVIITVPTECNCPEVEECSHNNLSTEPTRTPIVINPAIDNNQEIVCPELPYIDTGEGEPPLNDTAEIIPFVNDLEITKNLSPAAKTNIGSSAIVASFITLGLLPNLYLLATPGLLFGFFSQLFGRKTSKPWGVVTDSSSNEPLGLAVCKLFNSGTKNLTEQTITDQDGRYGFIISPGAYRLEVSKQGYVSQIEKIVIKENQKYEFKDIELIPNNLKGTKTATALSLNQLLHKIKDTYNKLTPVVLLFGLIISIISIINDFSILNLIILAVYTLLISYLVKNELQSSFRYSSVIDSSSKLRLPNALVKVFDPQTKQLVDTRLTNRNGHFDFWGDEGDYLINVKLKGYKFPSNIQTDLKTVYIDKIPTLQVKLKSGKNRLKILIDPIK